jgi:carbamate kinase
LRAARSRFNLDPEIVLTHVLVDKDDKEFRKPSKPIGKFYMKEHAEELMKKGFVMKQLLGGYRRVVPSPKPQSIVELKRIEQLLGTNHLVIAAGGGGIAVTREGRRLAYADAVLDKDLTSSLLATKLKADALFILTKVDGVFLNFDTKREKLLKRANVEYLQRLARKGCFEAGSMLPKVEACISFVKKTRNRAIVGNLNKPNKVFKLKDVTIVVS